MLNHISTCLLNMSTGTSSWCTSSGGTTVCQDPAADRGKYLKLRECKRIATVSSKEGHNYTHRKYLQKSALKSAYSM